MSDYKVLFSEIDWENPAPLVREKRVVLGAKVMRLLELQRGFVEAEWCTKAHTGYVLEGAVSVAFGPEATEFNASDGIDIPAGEASRHKATPLTERVLLLLIEPS